MNPANLLLLTQEKETAGAVRTVLESGPVKGTLHVCKGMVELKARLSQPHKLRRNAGPLRSSSSTC